MIRGKWFFGLVFHIYISSISISGYLYMLNYWRTAGHWEILSETCGLDANSRVDFPARVCDISKTKLVESSLVIHHHVTGRRSRFSGFYIQTSLMVLWAIVTSGVIVVYNHGSSISNGYTLWQFNIVFEIAIYKWFTSKKWCFSHSYVSLPKVWQTQHTYHPDVDPAMGQ